MSEIEFISIPVSNVETGDETATRSDTAVAAKELLKNGILVETNKGLVCMSLKDALNEGVGGLSLSEEDFQNVARELLFQEEPCQTITSDNVALLSNSDSSNFKKIQQQVKKINIRTKRNVNKIPILSTVQEVATESVENCEETVVGFSSVGYSSVVKIEPPEEVNPATVAVFTQKPSSEKTITNKRSLILKSNVAKPVISVQKIFKNICNEKSTVTDTKYKTNQFGSMLINPNNILERTQLLQENYVSCEETSDNSEVMPAVNDSIDKPAKKRGGWPKGRKRKPEIKSEIRPPKAPATGYVLFLNERRKDYRDMPFTEVTKMLGNEWSRLSLHEKKVYLDQAEIEKKRYREELKSYRQSEAYQIYLHKKRLKRLQGNGPEESDMDATDEIDEEDNEELYCRACDQWFHSLHNKKEHLYGRQHLQSIAGRCSRPEQEWSSANMSSTSLDESSLDGSYLNPNKKLCCGKTDSLVMDDSIVKFMVLNREREEERKILRKKLEEAKVRNMALTVDLQHLNKCVHSLTVVAENERKAQAILEQRLFNLLNVPTLFYLPDATNEENN